MTDRFCLFDDANKGRTAHVSEPFSIAPPRWLCHNLPKSSLLVPII